MKSIDLSTSPATLAELLDLAGADNLVVKTTDGREFILAEVDEFEQEIGLVRANEELMQFLAARSGEPGKHSLSEVKTLLGI